MKNNHLKDFLCGRPQLISPSSLDLVTCSNLDKTLACPLKSYQVIHQSLHLHQYIPW